MAHFFSLKKGTAKTSRAIAFLWQTLAVAALVVGASYIRWRWMASLNYDALWYAVPGDSGDPGYCGTILFTLNLWQVRDVKRRPPPRDIRQCLDLTTRRHRVRSKSICLSPPIPKTPNWSGCRFRMPNESLIPSWIIAFTFWMTASAPRCARRRTRSVNYLSRENNIGFKAGNL